LLIRFADETQSYVVPATNKARADEITSFLHIFRCRYDKEELVNATAQAFIATGDALSTVEILHSIVAGEEDTNLHPIKSASLLDSVLNQIITITPAYVSF